MKATIVSFVLVLAIFMTTGVMAQPNLSYESEDGDYSMAIHGRIQLDGAYFDEDATEIDNDTEFRRARIAIEGVMHSNWKYKAQFDFAGDDVATKDLYVQHKPSGVIFGQFNQPTGLSLLTSSKYITFLERPTVVEGLVSGRRIGVGWKHNAPDYTLFASIYDHETDGKDQAPGYGVRATWLPMKSENSLIHLGATLVSEGPTNDSADTSRFRSRPEAHLANRLVDTGNLADIDRTNKVGVEFAWLNGPWSAQSEYYKVDVSRDNGLPDADFEGYYVFGSYFLGNSGSRTYKKGSFGRSSINDASKGAWEIAARYSHLDLNDGDIQGGELDTITLGLNYYPHKHIRFMANYIMADSEKAGIDDDPNVFQIRAAIDW